jgi:excisionase family DNA binding protein
MTGVVAEILTVEEAARLLRLSPYTVRKLARQGRLPGRKVGRGWRFRKDLLLAWLEGRWEGADSAWLEAVLAGLTDRLEALAEPEAWLEAMARAARPARYLPGEGLIVEG